MLPTCFGEVIKITIVWILERRFGICKNMFVLPGQHFRFGLSVYINTKGVVASSVQSLMKGKHI